MSKKQQRRDRAEQQRLAAQPAQVAQPVSTSQTDLVKTKVASLIREVIGAAEHKREHLEAYTFVQRFNTLAQNTHPSLHLLAAIDKDGSGDTQRKVNVFHDFKVVGTWEPGDHRTGAAPEDQAEPEPDNVLQPGFSSLAEQRGEEVVKSDLDNGLTVSEAGAATAPAPAQADSAVVEIVAPIEPQVGAAPNDMKIPGEPVVIDGAAPAPVVEPVQQEQQQEQQEPPEKTAEDLAAEEEAKRTSEQQQEEQK